MWVGEEALMDSTQELRRPPPPLISRSLSSFLSFMAMNFPGIGGGFWAPPPENMAELEAATVIVMADLGSETTTTFCLVIVSVYTKTEPKKTAQARR